MNKLPTQPYKGTRDFLPEEMSVRTQLFERLFRTVELFGFRRYDGPILESAAIYEAKSGEEIANQQLYRLTDKGGRELALRPEMTPSVARIIAGNAESILFPARWYTHVNCHRYERPQRGRVREHWQLNVDIFGSEDAEAEVEIFDVVAALMTALGATPQIYALRVNDRILVEAALRNFVGALPEQMLEISMIIDRWEKIAVEERVQALAASGLDSTQIERVAELTGMDLDAFCQAAGAEATAKSHLAKIIREGLSEAPLKFDPLIIRAFNYYTSTVFEVFDVSPENRRSIFGGGRYDDLASLFTTKRIPGVGFGMGDVTTWNFLEYHHLLPNANFGPDVYVFGTRPEYRDAVRRTTRQLRQHGIRTEPALDAPSLRAGLKHASKLGVQFTVIVADDEYNRKNVSIKDMISTVQVTIPEDSAAAFLAGRFAAHEPQP
ncbi:MAG TPA: histidine--tRNA ligase [Bryobacteraceae bacterium]|nr:histidine--tRNA ligase [Bryobacteraceae bacterium]